MGDEYVCQDCNYGTDEKPNNDQCPLCKGSMVNIGEVDDDLKLNGKNDDYDDDEFDTPIDESLELDDDFVEEEKSDSRAKK